MADLIPRGEKGRLMGDYHGRARYKAAAIEYYRDLVESGQKTAAEIRKQYNIPKQTLSNWLNYHCRNVTPTEWKARNPRRNKGDGNGQA